MKILVMLFEQMNSSGSSNLTCLSSYKGDVYAEQFVMVSGL